MSAPGRPDHWRPVVSETDVSSDITETVFMAPPDVLVFEKSRPFHRGRSYDRKFYWINGVTACKTEAEARGL